MENRTIQITPTIIGVVVPSDMHISMFDYIERAGRIYLINHKNKDEIHISELDGLDYDDFEQIGICTLPSLYFDFEIDKSWVTDNNTFGYPNYLYSNKGEVDFLCPTPKESFRTSIQKAIQDEGLLIVNPHNQPNPANYRPMDAYSDKRFDTDLEQWQESESKVIRGKLLIIEKI